MVFNNPNQWKGMGCGTRKYVGNLYAQLRPAKINPRFRQLLIDGLDWRVLQCPKNPTKFRKMEINLV
jgi:hypothetical protein